MSKYLERFKQVNPSTYTLFGDRILIEPLQEEEAKTKGGIIIPTNVKNIKSNFDEQRALFAVVLAVGEGYYDDETRKDIPLTVKPGNVVMITKFGASYFTTYGPMKGYDMKEIGLSREGEVHMKWDNIDKFEEYFSQLNSNEDS